MAATDREQGEHQAGAHDSTERVRFDAVRVATDDLERATRRYALLLGSEPAHASSDVVRFALARGAVELVRGEPGRQSLRLTRVAAVGASDADRAGADAALRRAQDERFGGLDVTLNEASVAAAPQHPPSLDGATPSAGGFLAIDHVVIETRDPARALRLWRDALGVRLALDREFPQRGLRMLFFRSAGVTLEIVSALGDDGGGDDRLNGIAYRVADVARVRERLLAAGLNVSEVRTGNKQGTRVATVRDQTEGVPTLLIEALPRDARA